jgi:outer membrane lipoprotein-sorting protein
MNGLTLIILLFAGLGFSNSSAKTSTSKTKKSKSRKAVGFLPASFKANFVQEFKSSLSGKIKSSNGSVEYRYPGRIRFEVEKPNNTIFVSNAKKAWYYTAPYIEGEPGQVSISPSGKFPLSRFFDSLKKGLRSNKYYKVNKLMPGDYELTFLKKSAKEMGIAKAVLHFKKKKSAKFLNLERVQLDYLNKKKATIKLSKIQRNPKLTKKHFDFEIPKNTKISH